MSSQNVRVPIAHRLITDCTTVRRLERFSVSLDQSLWSDSEAPLWRHVKDVIIRQMRTKSSSYEAGVARMIVQRRLIAISVFPP
jgi:hypothetical protein